MRGRHKQEWFSFMWTLKSIFATGCISAHKLRESCAVVFTGICVCVCAHMCMLDRVPLFVTPWTAACPWDVPGKNTGVGCHFLLQRVSRCAWFSIIQQTVAFQGNGWDWGNTNDLCSAYWSKSLDQRIVTSLTQFLTSPRKGMWLSSFDQREEGISAEQRKLSEVVQVVRDEARSPNSKSLIFWCPVSVWCHVSAC